MRTLNPLLGLTAAMVLVAMISAIHYARAQAADPCAALARTALTGAEVESAEANTTGTVSGGRGAALTGVPCFCRVRGLTTPTPRSRIHFEAWLPLAGWNGRIQMIGNGGYSSAFSVSELAALVRQGSAAVATDTGHDGGELDFGYGNDDAIADWGHRAVHESIVSAKALAARFYGRPARYSYFAGCSTGGHQGLMEAQRYPEDFDGINVAGSANFDQIGNRVQYVWNGQVTFGGGVPLAGATLTTINKAVVAACDALDGVADGVIDDPRACPFQPSSLLCQTGQTTGCLTQAQVTALQNVYQGPRNPRTGEEIKVEAAKTVKFKAGQKFKDAVNA